jgi:hypothetical protein
MRHGVICQVCPGSGGGGAPPDDQRYDGSRGPAAPARKALHSGQEGSEGAAIPLPFMILKDFTQGVWKILQDHGSGAGGTTPTP